MQKDFHFYVTYALSMRIGAPHEEAEALAWSDQYTDDLTEMELHGIQTQSDTLRNWEDRHVQMSVLIPFHFIPGSSKAHPWMTTRNNARARRLLRLASGDDPLRLGIALHALQDTFSHEGFSGWREELNSCFPWYYVRSAIPNVGHADLRVIPDVTHYVWTDPRDGRQVDNRKRAMSAAKATWDFLAARYNPSAPSTAWDKTRRYLRRIFSLESYDKRKRELRDLSGNPEISYRAVREKLEVSHKQDFVTAASNHLSEAVSLFRDIPRQA